MKIFSIYLVPLLIFGYIFVVVNCSTDKSASSSVLLTDSSEGYNQVSNWVQDTLPDKLQDEYNEPVGSVSINVPQTLYTITLGESFDETEDVEFTVKDENGTDFSDDAVIGVSDDYDINIVGNYIITITYKSIVKEVILRVTTGPGLGEYWLSINDEKYVITKGESFDPVTDIDFNAKNKELIDANDDVIFIFSDGYDITVPGMYYITLEYEGLTEEVLLTVLAEDTDPKPGPELRNFFTTIEHEYKTDDTLIIIEEGLILDRPTIISTTLDGRDANIIEVNVPDNAIIGTIAEVGTYEIVYILTDPEDIECNAVYSITVEVISKE